MMAARCLTAGEAWPRLVGDARRRRTRARLWSVRGRTQFRAVGVTARTKKCLKGITYVRFTPKNAGLCPELCHASPTKFSTAQTPMLRPDTTRPYRNPLSLIVCRTTQRVANWEVTGYTSSVIVRFRHKGLQNLYERGHRRRVPSTHVAKIERILARLDEASDPAGMDLPGFRLHSLKGSLAGYWAVSVSRNWRVMFRFQGDHVSDVDLVDYH